MLEFDNTKISMFTVLIKRRPENELEDQVTREEEARSKLCHSNIKAILLCGLG